MNESEIGPVIVITWMFTLGGWAILIWNSNRIANRNETRSLCDRMIVYVQRLKGIASDLWINPVKSEAYADLAISSSISSIELLDRILSDCTKTKFISEKKYSFMRSEFTQGYDEFFNCATEEKTLCEKLRVIDEECTDAIFSIENTYIDLYLKKGFFNIAIYRYPNISLVIFLFFIFNLWYSIYILSVNFFF